MGARDRLRCLIQGLQARYDLLADDALSMSLVERQMYAQRLDS